MLSGIDKQSSKPLQPRKGNSDDWKELDREAREAPGNRDILPIRSLLGLPPACRRKLGLIIEFISSELLSW